jgi:hypothetical protein
LHLNRRHLRIAGSPFSFSLTCKIAQEISTADFLNCTKNTELTRRRFARTVSFASHKNSHRSLASRTAGTAQQHSQHGAVGSRAMKSQEWKTYRTRFLVKAKQLSSSLSFIDNLGRQHCGRKGDYLVESSDGVISIAPRQIFEDIYVPISLDESRSSDANADKKISAKNSASRLGPTSVKLASVKLGEPRFEPLQIEEVKSSPARSSLNSRADAQHPVRHLPAASVRRKLPQPFGDRNVPAARLRLM